MFIFIFDYKYHLHSRKSSVYFLSKTEIKHSKCNLIGKIKPCFPIPIQIDSSQAVPKNSETGSSTGKKGKKSRSGSAKSDLKTPRKSQSSTRETSARKSHNSRIDSAKDRDRESVLSTRSELSVTKMPIDPEGKPELINNLKSRSYFIELVYEKWNFTEQQLQYIDAAKAKELENNQVYQNINDRVNSAGSTKSKSGGSEKKKKGSKKGGNADKSPSRQTPDVSSKSSAEQLLSDLKSNLSKNLPKYNVSFILDREMAEQIDVKLDTEINDWLKREKLSWQYIDVPENLQAVFPSNNRSQIAEKIRQELVDSVALQLEIQENKKNAKSPIEITEPPASDTNENDATENLANFQKPKQMTPRPRRHALMGGGQPQGGDGDGGWSVHKETARRCVRG